MSQSYRPVALLVGAFFMLLVRPSTAQEADPGSTVQYTVEQYKPANYPVAMAFTADGRLFYTEKATGHVRLIHADGTSQFEPVLILAVDSLVERGLLGIALDPNYAENGYIWVTHTEPGTKTDYPANQIVRFTEKDGVGSDPQMMFSVPITNGELMHNGGNLVFDPNDLLYVSFGDYGDAANAQNLDVVPGKIHRFMVTESGLQPAPDNPFPNSSIYAYGLRNPFDFTLDPYSGQIFAAENGPKCDDEIDLILPGKNYGWSADYGDHCYGLDPVDVPDYMPPLISYDPTIGMSGITVYSAATFPEWDGQIFFCNWNEGSMQRVVLNEKRDQIEAVYPVDLQGRFCRIDVAVGADGAIYFTDPSGIYRIVPKA
jgi:glucose/arabinose dehydrogenase